jgi:hypothetical protein
VRFAQRQRLVQDACGKIDVAPLGRSPSNQQGFACELEATLVQRPCRCQLPQLDGL